MSDRETSVALSVIYGLSCRCHPEDGTRYVGQTRVGLKRRFTAHCHDARIYDRPIHRWFRKHGSLNVEMTVLEVVDDTEDLDAREIHWISELDTFVRTGGNGLNMTIGGRNSLSHPDSAASAAEKNRGEGSPLSKLTWEDVRSIRAEHALLTRSMGSFASQYGVTESTISMIVRNVTWKDPDYEDTGKRYSKKMGGLVRKGARFNAQQISEIRSRYSDGITTLENLAVEFGCSFGMISLIVSNKSYYDPDYIYLGNNHSAKASRSAKAYHDSRLKP